MASLKHRLLAFWPALLGPDAPKCCKCNSASWSEVPTESRGDITTTATPKSALITIPRGQMVLLSSDNIASTRQHKLHYTEQCRSVYRHSHTATTRLRSSVLKQWYYMNVEGLYWKYITVLIVCVTLLHSIKYWHVCVTQRARNHAPIFLESLCSC